jgi:hypothetical protein
MKAGTVPTRNMDRDTEMVTDYHKFKASGKPFTARMVAKYKISMTRIYDVLKANGVVIAPRRAKK